MLRAGIDSDDGFRTGDQPRQLRDGDQGRDRGHPAARRDLRADGVGGGPGAVVRADPGWIRSPRDGMWCTAIRGGCVGRINRMLGVVRQQAVCRRVCPLQAGRGGFALEPCPRVKSKSPQSPFARGGGRVEALPLLGAQRRAFLRRVDVAAGSGPRARQAAASKPGQGRRAGRGRRGPTAAPAPAALRVPIPRIAARAGRPVRSDRQWPRARPSRAFTNACQGRCLQQRQVAGHHQPGGLRDALRAPQAGPPPLQCRPLHQR